MAFCPTYEGYSIGCRRYLVPGERQDRRDCHYYRPVEFKAIEYDERLNITYYNCRGNMCNRHATYGARPAPQLYAHW